MKEPSIKKSLVCLIVVFLFSSGFSQISENTVHNPIIDSDLTLEKALEGLDPSCPDDIKNRQALVDVLYYSFDGLIHKGQIVIDQGLADDVAKVFQTALDEQIPIESVIPIAQFGWSDKKSMARNNTSGFNYREVTGGKKLSNHAYGFAVDINPFLNPYIKGEVIQPAGAIYDTDNLGTLTSEHIIVETFLGLGWEWGGHWTTLKDYQHFKKAQ